MKIQDVSVLVVDDVDAMTAQIKELLKKAGFEKVLTAKNGVEAREILATGEIHIVLCDWHMAPFSGIELLKVIRQTANLAELAFIMVTAERTSESVVKAIKSGVDDYLLKPLTIEQIYNKVFKVLVNKKVLS